MTEVRTGFIVLLGALTMLPPLSIDLSLPGLPIVSSALHAPRGTIQWTLSAFIFAFGAGQLVVGPLSDRRGRRPVLLCGLAGFTVLAIGCALATNVYLLIALRFLQGLTACAGTVCSRAMVADVSRDRTQATSLQAYVSATNALAPITAPMLGVLLLTWLNWRWLYGGLGLVGIGLFAASYFQLKETATARAASGVLAGYRRVLQHQRVVPLAAVIFFAFAGYFAMISSSPLVLELQMHVSGAMFALAFAANAASTMAGSFVAGRFSHRFGADRLLTTGPILLLIAGVTALGFGVYAPSPMSFTVTMAAYAFSYGMTVPGAYGMALSEAGADAGSGSALLGAAQMTGGALGSALSGSLPLLASTSVGIVAAVAACGVMAAARSQPRTPTIAA